MNRNIQYWIDYWKSLFSGVESQRFSLSLISPRILLCEMKEEIKLRNLRNDDNRQFFYTQIKKYYTYDIPTQRCLHHVLTLLQREFDKRRLDIMVQLCQHGLSIMDSLEYYDHAVDVLREQLLSEKHVTRENLNMLCQDLIVELLEAGYSQKYIEEIPENIFAGITEYGDSIITNYPHGLSFPADPNARNAYKRSLTLLMKGLSDVDRINVLKKYPRVPRRNLRFIFPVRGIKGEISFDIGPVHFYSPTKEKIIKDQVEIGGENHPELFGGSENLYLNAVVKVSTLDAHSGAAIAKRKIIKAINCLNFILGSPAKYEVGLDYIVVNESDRNVGSSFKTDPRYGRLHWLYSRNVTTEALEAINSSIIYSAAPKLITEELAGSVEHRLMDSLHWFRKGNDADAPEDQILWLWIAIESILSPVVSANSAKALFCIKGRESVVTIAFELLPRLRCIFNAYDRGWTLYHKLDMMHSTHSSAFITVPNEVMQKAGLKPGNKQIHLRDFVEAIPVLLKHLPDSELYDQLNDAYNFYTDSKQACEMIETELKAFRDDVIMLYRIRNKIVHDATVGDTVLPYYIKSATQFAGQLILKSLEQFFEQRNESLPGIVAALFSEYDFLLQKIEKDGPAIALFEK